MERLTLKRKHSSVVDDDGSVPATKKADVRLLEPCFVNPNSYEAVRVPLREIGTSAGLTEYGGTKRKWLTIECDGLPNVLVRKGIHKAREKALCRSHDQGWYT